MSEEQKELAGFNRRDFLKGGSVATVMAMLGGVEIVAPSAKGAEPEAGAPAAGPAANSDDSKKAHYTGEKIRVGIVGLGAWGREILNALVRDELKDICVVAALCDTYESAIKRAAKDMKDVVRTPDYKTIMD